MRRAANAGGRRPRRGLLGRALLWAGVVAGSAAGLGGAWIAWPLPEGMLAAPSIPTLRLLDAAGAPLRTARSGEGALRQWVPLARMNPALLVGFVAAEDRRFFSHHGVDPLALGRALRDDLRAGRVTSGASTLTMQLARILRPSPRNLPGKLAQIFWALRLDAHLSKQTILEQYLNRVPLGQGTIGVEEAAGLYFGASAGDLSVGQAAELAGLAGAPSRDNPFADAERAARRRALVLARMQREGNVSAEEAGRSRTEPVALPPAPGAFLAPHFGAALLARFASRGLEPSGDVVTTLDLPLQAGLEAEVRHTVETMGSAGVRHAAAVALDNRTGGVLAWVGSPDFFEPKTGQVDMVISPRQPGSALKPFLYGLAFDRGYTPASVLPDLATVYQTGTGPYAPRNYDRRFHGPVRAREALASSFNVPAVELADRLGPSALLALLRRAGFRSLRRDAEHYGLGLALGNGDVTLLEIANAYRALANGGVWRPARWLAGEEAEREAERRVMSPGAAALLLDILADPIARIPGFGPVTPLEFPFPAAAKTGTSRHFTDNWAVAVTGGFTVAVWVGNFDGRPMEGVSGVTGAGPLLHRAALLVAARHPAGALPSLQELGALPVDICRLSGLRAGPHCPAATEWFLPGTVPATVCDWHDADGGVTLPGRYADWAAQAAGAPAVAEHASARPPAPDSVAARFHITSPATGDVYRFVPGVDPRYATIGLRAVGAPSGARVRWTVDGRPFGAARLPLVPGRHRIRAAVDGGPTALRDEVEIEVVGEARSD